MKPSIHRLLSRRWLLPVLVMLLVVGHACELPAFGDLIGRHDSHGDDATPAEHDHEGAEALACDATLVVPSPAFAHASPAVVIAVAQPELAAVPVGLSPTLSRATRSATGPPLFLLFSSLLI